MDFFARQDQTRKQSVLLLLVFTAVLLAFAVLINGFASAATYYLSGKQSMQANSLYSISLTLMLWSFILLGCWFRYLDVKGGGRKLAERFGASAVLTTSRQQAERELLEIAAEMAIAATVPVPASYCLHHESAINAFVVGSGDDVALVVSRGALDMLDREELMGVVGHEFAHIVNHDLASNMRLLIALGGLHALDEIGSRLLAGAGFFNSAGGGSQKHHASIAAAPLLLAGLILKVVGFPGVLGGSIVKAAFSRQREYLADASSVQFTRNPYALASALDRVEHYSDGTALHSEYAKTLAHLCFQVSGSRIWFARLLNTHPPLRARIKAIDPHFQVKARKKRSRDNTPDKASSGRLHAAAVPSNSQLKPSGLSDRFELFASGQQSCLAILFALFVSPQADRAERYFSALGFAYNKDFKAKVKNVHQQLGRELDISKLRIIEYIVPTLIKLEKPKRQHLLLNIEKLVDVEQENSLANFAALQLIRRRLDAEIPVLDKVVSAAPGGKPDSGSDSHLPRVRPISELGKELSLLLSLMVEASGHKHEKVLEDYARVLRCYTTEQYPLRSVDEQGLVAELEAAFYALYRQPLPQRLAFVRHCEEIMHFDGIEMQQERYLLKLIAASLDVPELAA